MKMIFLKFILAYSLLYALPSYAQNEAKSVSPCKAKSNSQHMDENRIGSLQKIRDIINSTQFDKIIFRCIKQKSSKEIGEKFLKGNDIYDYRIDKELDDNQRKKLMFLLRNNLQVPKIVRLELEGKKRYDAPTFSMEYLFFKDGKCLVSLNYKRLTNTRYKNSYVSFNNNILKDFESFTHMLRELIIPK